MSSPPTGVDPHAPVVVRPSTVVGAPPAAVRAVPTAVHGSWIPDTAPLTRAYGRRPSISSRVATVRP
ncbi:hypothetical protein RND61_29850 [Streptomyces sp. TRM76323]|uniref:Uncharacterized protein n=1 Tax=Streptomyces tamarix TaxID=3078565 RepID=A0ABU3QTZ1_9ACTN|nr:hypothetical protein [Streptomyces tamarix]MDT9686240.1 hypothetical protein [Streptomyces tamarix]